MTDAAQGEPPKHEVFSKPFKVEPVSEEWNTPPNYRRGPGGDKLPDKLKVWLVQKTADKPGTNSSPHGVVSLLAGYKDPNAAEALAEGFNTGTNGVQAGVGRHGNFLQWGFSAPPSKMTDAGRKLFLNCVCYIAKFDGKRP